MTSYEASSYWLHCNKCGNKDVIPTLNIQTISTAHNRECPRCHSNDISIWKATAKYEQVK